MDIDNIRIRETDKLNALLINLKSYIEHYDLLPVLSKAFINDNFIFTKQNGTVNDDFLLSAYITDLYLSFQKEKVLQPPTESIIDDVFACCMDIYQSCFILGMVGDTINENIKDDVLMLKYTERSFYIPVFASIFANIVDKKFLLFFYRKTGFDLQHVFIFRALITFLIQDQYNNKAKYSRDMLVFSAEDILNYINRFFHNCNEIDIKQIQSFIDYFLLDSSSNIDYLPKFNNSIESKPLFSYQDKYICSVPLGLVKNIYSILEKEIDSDPSIRDEYFASKGANLESLTRNILTKLFPEADIYQGLEYFASDKKWHETDVIVDLGNYLIIIEAKARKFRSQARQGNQKIFNSSINNIIAEAHEQCRTTYEYIQKNDTASFSKHKGKDSFVSFRRNNFIDIFYSL